MTLVLTLLTHSHILQVSDRRVTFHRNGALVDQDDMRNKSLLYCTRFGLTYSGLAEIGRHRRTDLWLLQHISEHVQIAPAINALPEVMASEVARFPRSSRYLAVRAAGWRFDRDGSVHPVAVTVSNFHATTREYHASDGLRFLTEHDTLDDDAGFALSPLGVGVPPDRWRRLVRNLGAVGRRRLSLMPILRLLTDEVREVAKLTPLVGRGLMVTVLPRSAVRQDQDEAMVLTGGAPHAETPTFHYLAAEEDEYISYGPLFTCGGSMMADFEMRPLSASDADEIERQERQDWRENPRLGYVVPVILDEESRRPDLPEGHPYSAYYHGDEVLVLTTQPLEQVNARPIPTRSDLEALHAEWGEALPDLERIRAMMFPT